MKIFSLRFFVGIGLTVLISYLLLQQVSLRDVRQAFLLLRPTYLAGATLILVAVTLLKSWRFNALLSEAVSFAELIPIVLVHNVFINFLPSRSGEVAYPYLLKRRHKITMDKSISSLVIGRVFDVLVILLLIASSILLVRPSFGAVTTLLPEVGLGIAVLLVIFFLLTYKAGWLYKVFDRFFLRSGMYEKKFFGVFLKRCMELLRAFTPQHSHAKLAAMAMVTVGIWLLTFGFEFVLFRGLNLPISYGQFLIASLFPILTHIIPVQSFAAIGTYEATITGGFILLGFAASQVIPLTFTVHIVQLCFTLLFGLVGFVWYLQQRVKAKSE